jgi:uncharacterized protein YqeY
MMAALMTPLRLGQWKAPQCLRLLRSYSTPSTSTTPPLLLKLRGDLKTAMKAKDTARLNVLRGVLADITNASKTSTPASTDMQVVALLRKRSAASKAAVVEFKEAKREDLVGKEEEQISILEGYAGEVATVPEEEIVAAIKEMVKMMTVDGAKVNMGSLVKKMIGPGGVYDGKNVEAKTVAKLVQAELDITKS